jgi:tetratricopeptide (TPR) repeat protein
MNERFVFVPSIGLLLLVAFGIWKLSEHKNRAMIATVLMLVLVSGYGVKTFTRNFAWKSDKTLFLTDVKVSTNSIKCNVSAGGTCIEMAKAEVDTIKKTQLVTQGFGYLQKAQVLHPQSFYAWFLMGNGYLELSNFDLAISYYAKSLNVNPENKEALNNLLYVAQNTYKNGKFESSVNAYKVLAQYDTKNIDYQIMIADGFSHINKVDSALDILDEILYKNPKNASAWSKKGEIYGRVKNDLNSAEYYLKKSLELNPNDLSANENLGIVYGIQKKFKESLTFFFQALKVDSTQARIYQNIAGTYNAMGDKVNAQMYQQKASQIGK